MPGKRKRGEKSSPHTPTQDHQTGNGKPISAIAAARLKAAAQAEVPAPVSVPVTDNPEVAPPSPFPEGPESDYPDSEPEDPAPLISKNFQLCTWRNFDNDVLFDTENELTIDLKKHSTVSFIGCFDLKVLRGAININGANIGAVSPKGAKNKAYRVFVPSTSPIPKIRGLDHTNHVQILHCNEPTPFATINPLFSDIWATTPASGQKRSFNLITESDADPLKRPLVPENAPEDWLRAIEDICNSPSSTIITGAPSSGKSTFARRLLNRFLTGLGKTAKAVNHVCYIDLDPSKPQYTPPGQLSLTIVRNLNLGPSFTHPTTTSGVLDANETIAAYPLPTRSVTNYEEYFISCVKALFHRYKELTPTPASLIINTPPSLYTTHFHLLQTLLTTIKPTHIIHLDNTTAILPETALKLDTLSTLSKQTSSTLHELTAQPPLLTPQRTDAEISAMHMQSYFHLSSTTAQNKYNPNPLSSLTPWEFAYEETSTRTQDFLAFLPLSEPLAPSHLSTALNGSIIHIVELTESPDSAPQAFEHFSRTPKWKLPYYSPDRETHMVDPPNPHTSRILCTALIRGFDPANRIVQVLVPKTHDDVLRALAPQRTIFVAGCCDTPAWAYMEDAYAQLHDKKEAMGTMGGATRDDVLLDEIDLPPWVEKKSVLEGMGYLGTVRRVRKFLDSQE